MQGTPFHEIVESSFGISVKPEQLLDPGAKDTDLSVGSEILDMLAKGLSDAELDGGVLNQVLTLLLLSTVPDACTVLTKRMHLQMHSTASVHHRDLEGEELVRTPKMAFEYYTPRE